MPDLVPHLNPLAPGLTIADQAQQAMLRQIESEYKGRAGATITTSDGRTVSAKLYISGQVGRWDVTAYGRLSGGRQQALSGEAGLDISIPIPFRR